MPKASVTGRENRRRRAAQKFSKVVAKLKKTIRTGSSEEVDEAVVALNRLPRDAHKCRQVRRCRQCQRPRGVFRRFGLCRICLRKAASLGDITGISKSSW